jgi:hypothetical protein
MHPLKPISTEAVGAALEKALRYRLLNEPIEAESICLDVLQADSDNQEALLTLVLARTDLFESEYTEAFERAKSVLPKLTNGYERAYYEGVIYERWAKSQTARRVPIHVVTGWYLQAMRCFERAEKLAPADNPDAILRWNSCARLLARSEKVEGEATEASITRDIEAEFGEEVQAAGRL